MTDKTRLSAHELAKEIREGEDIVSPEIKAKMQQRTNWGELLGPATYNPPAWRQPQSMPRFPDW